MGKQIRQLARAKVNLTLHVGGLRADGYHAVDSLVVFADVSDELTFRPSDKMQLAVKGADELPSDRTNLILRAMDMMDAPPHDITLTKILPISAGLGGGSANAAAALRQFKTDISHSDLAFNLGADIPVCLNSETAMMRGIGEEVLPLSGLGQLSAVLVNPGVAVSTHAIFKAMDSTDRQPEPRPNVRSGDLLSRTLAGENEMQDFAIAQAPEILDALRALAQQTGCELARMSGSGATCFGIFRSDAQAEAAAKAISSSQSGWWVRDCRLGDAVT